MPSRSRAWQGSKDKSNDSGRPGSGQQVLPRPESAAQHHRAQVSHHAEPFPPSATPTRPTSAFVEDGLPSPSSDGGMPLSPETTIHLERLYAVTQQYKQQQKEFQVVLSDVPDEATQYYSRRPWKMREHLTFEQAKTPLQV